MRTLNAQEMDAASGGVIPVIAFVVAAASLVTKGATASKVLTSAGFALAGVGVGAYGFGVLSGELTWDGLRCKG